MPPSVSSSEKSRLGAGPVSARRSSALKQRVRPTIVSIRLTVPGTTVFRSDQPPRDPLDTHFIEAKSFPTWLTESVLNCFYTLATVVMFQRSFADLFIPPRPERPFR